VGVGSMVAVTADGDTIADFIGFGAPTLSGALTVTGSMTDAVIPSGDFTVGGTAALLDLQGGSLDAGLIVSSTLAGGTVDAGNLASAMIQGATVNATTIDPGAVGGAEIVEVSSGGTLSADSLSFNQETNSLFLLDLASGGTATLGSATVSGGSDAITTESGGQLTVQGSLLADDAGNINVFGALTVGGDLEADSGATVFVSGAGATLDDAGSMTFGNGGPGSLTVEDGAAVTVDGSLVAGVGTGDFGGLRACQEIAESGGADR
jgi:fibronectin-binding autotransporter adhesin